MLTKARLLLAVLLVVQQPLPVPPSPRKRPQHTTTDLYNWLGQCQAMVGEREKYITDLEAENDALKRQIQALIEQARPPVKEK